MNNATITDAPRILVVGMDGAGAEGLPAMLLTRIQQAHILVGGQRHLDAFPAFGGERLGINCSLQHIADRLQQARDQGHLAVVLASGDPLCYGIGTTLLRHFVPDALEFVPAPSAFQLASAALGETWIDFALLSAHARPLPDVIECVQTAPKAAILTDHQHTPAAIAHALLAAGLSPTTACAVCENLGYPEQRIVRATLASVAAQAFAALNVFVVWREGDAGRRGGADTGMRRCKDAGRHDAQYTSSHRLLSPSLAASAPGLPDTAFATTGGLITSREVRLLSLAELALGPGEVLWDIGAGSGAVGIEAARSQPTAQVHAVEKRNELCQLIYENLRRFPAPNFHLTEGTAPAVCQAWPDPDAVFIGGSGGQLAALIALVQARLRPGGRLVINLVTLENLQTVRTLLPDARVVQVQISVGQPIQDMLRFAAQNPVFIVSLRREA